MHFNINVYDKVPSMAYASSAFTIAAIVFMILVCIMYIGKKKYKNIENNVFLFMIILTIFLLIWELVYVLAIDYYYMENKLLNVTDYIATYGKDAFRYFFKLGKFTSQNVPLKSYFDYTNVIPSGPLNIICRIYLTLASLWVVSLFGYIWILALKHREKPATKKNYRMVFLMITALFVVGNIISLYPNLVIEHKQILTGMYVFGGDAVTSLYAIAFVVTIIVVVALVKSGKAIPKEQKVPIYFSFFIFISTTAAQLIFNFDVNDLTYIFAFIMTTLYLTIESQDYQLVDELKKKKDEAEIADNQKTAFLSNMSHEIRTPLNTILGFSDAMLNEKNITEEVVLRDTRLIYDASNVLLDLINNILDISRIESGKEVVENRTYDLQDLIMGINTSIKDSVDNKTLKFNINVDGELPNKYQGDFLKVQKIITNVLKNAKKYTNYGEINLNIGGIKYDETKYTLKFVVSNTGHAMKEEDFDKDFNDFVMLGTGSQNTIDSVTLGLLVAKQYISMLGGEIKFYNETGHGTRYVITINQEVLDFTKIGNINTFAKATQISEEDFIDCTGKKALVVDDNALNLKLVEKLLAPYNFTTTCVKSGMEALEKVKGEHYDILFLDHMMPDMDGIETLKALNDSGYFVPPAIALTANSYSGLKEKYLSEGFSDYIAKPINVMELNEIIKRFFSN